jgi:hypothetical protein
MVIAPLTAVRTTLLLSSQAALRQHGWYPMYVERIESCRDALLSLYAGAWVGVDVATAHYEACDRIGLGHASVIELGRMVSHTTHNVFAAAAVRLSRELGATPWALFGQASRFWARSWRGSAVTIERIGPKDAHIVVVEMPFARIPYFRVALGGFAIAMAEFAARKAFAHALAHECTDTTLGYHLAWV